MTPEAKVKAKIKKLLKDRGVYHFSPIGGAYSVAGVPDLICCYKGRFIGIEVKAPGRERTVTALQHYHLDGIREAGGIAIVATNVEQVEAALALI